MFYVIDLTLQQLYIKERIRQPDKVEYVREICNYVVGNITPDLIIYMQGKAIDAFNRRKKKTENVNRYDTKESWFL